MKHQDDIAGMTMELGRLIRREMSGQCGKNQSPLQLHALAFIQEHPGMTMSEFASHMNVSPSTATVFVDRLVRLTFVKRNADKTNRKMVRLLLTPQGGKVLTENKKLKQLVLHKIFAPLSSADKKELARIFSLLLTHTDSPSSHD